MRLDENIQRIKEVMGLITEAEQPSNAVEINLGNLFESGKYKLSQQAISSVNSAIIKLRDFAKKILINLYWLLLNLLSRKYQIMIEKNFR